MSAPCCGPAQVIFTSSTGSPVLDAARCTGCGRRWELVKDGNWPRWKVVRGGETQPAYDG